MENNQSKLQITKHAYMRLKERNGWNKKTSDRMIQKVFADGLRYDNIKGYIRIWLKEYGYSDNSDYVLYGRYIYIFKDNCLITSFPVPNRETVRNRYFTRKEVA